MEINFDHVQYALGKLPVLTCMKPSIILICKVDAKYNDKITVRFAKPLMFVNL